MGPLDGVTIIELAGLGALPFATLKLADMGADVIRVHPPGEVPDDEARRTATASSTAAAARSPSTSSRPRASRSCCAWSRRPTPCSRRSAPASPSASASAPTCCSPATPSSSTAASPAGARTGRSRRGPATRSTTRPSPAPSARSACPARSPRPAAAGARRLRRRWPAHGLRRGVRPVRGAALGPGPGRRHRDGRRRDVALLGLLRDDPERRARRAGRHEPVRRRRALLQRLRDLRRAATSPSPPSSRSFYAQLLEKIGLDPAELPAQYDESRWPELRERLAEVVPHPHPRRVDRAARGHRRLLRPGAVVRRGARAPAQQGPGLVRRRRGLHPAAAPGTAAEPHARRGAPHLRLPGVDTEAVLRENGFADDEIAALADTGTVAWSHARLLGQLVAPGRASAAERGVPARPVAATPAAATPVDRPTRSSHARYPVELDRLCEQPAALLASPPRLPERRQVTPIAQPRVTRP